MGLLSQTRFRGQSLNRLDSKGRLRIPAKFREVLDSHGIAGVIVTATPKHLDAYTPEAWEKFEAKTLSASEVDPNHRAFMRYYISAAEECELDKQGRILIPPIMRKKVGIEQEVMLAGMVGSFEIWDKERWEIEMQDGASNFDELAKGMAAFGF